MIGALVRVIVGFILASLMAGLVFVLFALPPTELASDKGPGLAAFADWSLKSGTQAAIFAAPFALIAAAIGEWQRLRGPGFYILAGILIATAGFLAQHSSETSGQHTVLNGYAIKAFLTSGFFAGLLYWLIAGRVAGEDDPEPAAAPVVPAKKAEPVKPAADARVPDVKAADVKPAEVKAALANLSGAKPAEPKAAEVKAAEPKPAAIRLTEAVEKASEKAADAAKGLIDEARPVVKDPEAKA